MATNNSLGAFQVVLALGFPNLNAIPNQHDSQMILQTGCSQPSNAFNVGGMVVRLLLQQLLYSITDALKEAVWSPLAKKKTLNQSVEVFDNVYNPAHSRSASPISKHEARLDQYLDGGVFASVHEHLATMVEIRR